MLWAGHDRSEKDRNEADTMIVTRNLGHIFEIRLKALPTDCVDGSLQLHTGVIAVFMRERESDVFFC